MEDCLFCKIVSGEIPGEIVHTTERTVAFRDINPQAATHVLVVPKTHHANAAELAAADPQASAELVTTAAAIATAEGYDDYRLVYNTGAGHMHLLGRKISIETNPGTPEAKTILDIPIWDFDNQGSKPLKEPVHLDVGDTVNVTCRHVQWLRDVLPAFAEQREDRYILWAEGSTDEMCLGTMSVAFDDES